MSVGRAGASIREIEAIYRGRFRAFIMSVTALVGDGDAALDAVQGGFATALARRKDFRGEGSLEGWVWRIVLNTARDQRRAGRRPHHTERGVRDEPEPIEGDVRALLLALPNRQRLAIFLRYYAGLSYPQIAEVMEVAPGTVAASLNAAHAALRRELKEVIQ